MRGGGVSVIGGSVGDSEVEEGKWRSRQVAGHRIDKLGREAIE